uniref:Uncharacterized protein n=2 Tax=Wuchereria bancrofti TaxID=6293 RepID=A0A1I8E9Z2_WUCBA
MFYGRVRGWVTKESATFRLCFLPVQPSAREVHVCEVERIHYGIPVRGISMPTAKCGVGIVRLQAKESLDLEDDGDTMPRVGQGSTARTSEGRGRDELPRQASKQCGMVEDRRWQMMVLERGTGLPLPALPEPGRIPSIGGRHLLQQMRQHTTVTHHPSSGHIPPPQTHIPPVLPTCKSVRELAIVPFPTRNLLGT